MSCDLVGLGQISLDHVATLAEIPASGTTARIGIPVPKPGGQVATALRVAQRLGLHCVLVGAVGDDPAASLALDPLVEEGVDTRHVKVSPGVATRQAWVLVEADSGERTILAQRDPALIADPPTASLLEAARALHIDLEHPAAAREAVARAHRVGIPVLLDADQLSDEALAIAREVEFPIVSKGFADQLSGNTSQEAALRALTGPRTRMAVVTRGAQGSVALLDGRQIATAATQVRAVDTTGAGDVFRGAFAWALLKGLPLERVLEVANRAAAIACRGQGAQGSLPQLEDLEGSAGDRPI